MFIGRYQHTIDPKGRVSIPARYRTTLAQYEGNLIVVPQEQCLDVYPFTAWERVVGALNDQSQFDERLRRVGRLWISRAKEVELDRWTHSASARQPAAGGTREGRDARRPGARFLRDLGPQAVRGVRAGEARRVGW